ncbi:hypothetical protein [Paracidovorax konjaci]|uniref:Phage integrase family protein n=1 Tax=Paracidovorax konjaci TaxID=32040 RepID=A0A1I1X151_9BURK|nr:hypothetical protein [Paracidovorax konjaci]SFE01077.1 hypothetical protein SAMN04489710_111146 [Paracidovorax konjaci]
MQNVIQITRPPEPTLHNPHAQVVWAFYQVERENEEPTAATFRYAKNKYIEYLEETQASYAELKDNPRFYLHKHWETDALIRFCKWLEGRLTSKTRYNIYKAVRQVMDFTYALRIIDNVVYPPPVFKGVRETDFRAAYDEEAQEVINAALARWVGLATSMLRGYTPTGMGIPYKRSTLIESITLDGRGVSVADAALIYGVPHALITSRIKKGWTAREAVGLDARVRTANGISRDVVVEGVIYTSLAAAGRAYNVSQRAIAHKLQRGCTPEQAVGLVPISVQQSDERALLWAFENNYGCDPLAMLADFRIRRLAVVCPEKRMRMLFHRWGVWPFIDDRLIMPLTTELGVLAGLNVESLKLLEIDSFQDEHGLTGEPAIVFRKGRSGSGRRSDEQALHLSLLELEEVFLPGHVVKQVKTLFNIILALTSRIRHNAPSEVARRLVIFEDVEATRREGQQVIVGLDPRGKAGSWYARFKREEGLTESLGKDFSFNISRCRPTLVTNMVLAGASLLELQTVLCHADIATSITYLDEHQLQPAFHREVSGAMDRMVRRSKEHQQAAAKMPRKYPAPLDTGFTETLSGCDCRDPCAPSENVRIATKHVEGTVCKFWNMCLFCDQAIVTEASLPRIMVYHQRVNSALESNSPAIRPREKLFKDVVTLIDGIIKEDVIFPRDVIEEARCKSVALDDVLVDQLIYQGI